MTHFWGWDKILDFSYKTYQTAPTKYVRDLLRIQRNGFQHLLSFLETCYADPLKQQPGTCGCGISDGDSDHDGFLDCQGC